MVNKKTFSVVLLDGTELKGAGLEHLMQWCVNNAPTHIIEQARLREQGKVPLRNRLTETGDNIQRRIGFVRIIKGGKNDRN